MMIALGDWRNGVPERDESLDPETARYTYHPVTSWGQKRKERNLRSLLDAILPELKDGSRIVEIGPGRGELARILVSRGFDYVAVEPSEALYAELEAVGVTVIQAEVPPLPVDDQSCDVVISFDVFEHFRSYRDAMSVCRESLRALRAGGYLTIVAPNYDTLGPLFYLYEYQHSFPTNRCRLEGLLQDAGFELRKSTAFLTSLGFSPLWPLDRILAHVTLAIVRNSFFIALFRGLGLASLLFRLHKNCCDHVTVIGQKPKS